MNLKFLPPLLGFSIGIFLTADIISGWIVPLFSFAFTLISWIIIYFLSKKPDTGYRIAPFHTIWVFTLFLSLGSLDFSFNSAPYIEENIEQKNYNFTGEITDIKYNAKGDIFKIKILNLQDSTLQYIPSGNIDMLLYTDGFLGSKGDIINFNASPVKVSNSNSYSSDYAGLLYHQGIDYRANVKFTGIKKIGESGSLFNYFESIRKKLIINLENSSLHRDTAVFLISLLLGEKSYLYDEQKATLSSSGLSHILALSGMHVALMLTFIMALLFPLSLFGLHKIRKLGAITLIWCYVLLTGMSPSTVRAAIMATFIITAYMLQRKNSALNALFVSVLVLLIFNPLYLWDIGLQLSFICVAAILLFSNKLNPIHHHNHPYLYKIVNGILITVISTLSPWAMISFYFKTLPLQFLPANIVLLPLLPIFIGASMIFLIFISFGLDLQWISRFLDFFHENFMRLAGILSHEGDAVLSVNFPWYSTLFWLSGIFMVTVLLYSHNKIMKRIAGVLISCFVLLSLISPIINQDVASAGNLRFQHSFTKIEARYKTDLKSVSYIFPRNCISSLKHDSFTILSIDAPVLPRALQKIKEEISSNHFLIVGQGADFNQIAELANEMSFKHIILHSGIGKNKKMEIIHLINEPIWDNVYSLNDNSSLEIEI